MGEWINLLFGLLFWGLIAAIVLKRFRRGHTPAVDGPPNEIYKVFSTKFDLIISGDGLNSRLISGSPDYSRGWFKIGNDAQATAVSKADSLIIQLREEFAKIACADFPNDLSQDSLAILIDRSGSMRDDPMVWSAVVAKLASEELLQRGAEVELLGFSTVGWQGGFARELWKAKGKPKRPGRLCALLHMVYQSRQEKDLTIEGWKALLNPNSLRENVDGEAILWASERLLSSNRTHRHLIIISDGAPVDDSTIFENGPNYLVRHLTDVLDDLEKDDRLKVGALGVRFEVDQYYSCSVLSNQLEDLPQSIASLIAKMVVRDRAG